MGTFRVHRKPKISPYANRCLAPRYLRLRRRILWNKSHKCIVMDIVKYANTLRECTEQVKKSMTQAVKRMGELETEHRTTMSNAATKARIVLACARNIKTQMRVMRRLCKVGPPRMANPQRVLSNREQVQQLECGLALATSNVVRIVKGWDTLVADANVFSKIVRRPSAKR